MKALLSVLLLCLACFAPGLAAYADATDSGVESTRKPALIIRFNQPSVQYKQPLVQVVEKVQDITQDAHFELVSIVPLSKERSRNNASREIAEYNARKVAAVIESQGVPATHVHIRYRESEVISMNEVHVAVY